MKNKKFLIVCAVLTVAGVVMSAAGVAMGGIVHGIRLGSRGLQISAPALQDGSAEKSVYSEKKQTVDAFSSMEIALEYADIRVEASETDEYRIAYALPKNQEIECSVSKNKLVIKQAGAYDNGFFKFGDLSFFSLGSFGYESGAVPKLPQAVVYVPKKAQLTDVSIKTESGNVVCQDIQAGNLALTADYGDVKLENVQADEIGMELESGNLDMKQVQGKNCKVQNEYGDITINNIVFSGDMDVKLESGDISCQNARMQDLLLENSYGEVSGHQIKLRNLHAELESSSCSLDDIKLDKCEIESEYGDVNLALSNPLTGYGYNLSTEYGEITIDGEKMGESYHSLEHDNKDSMIIHCESGDIDIK